MTSVSNQFPGSEDFGIHEAPSNRHHSRLTLPGAPLHNGGKSGKKKGGGKRPRKKNGSKRPRGRPISSSLEDEIPFPHQQIKKRRLFDNGGGNGKGKKRFRNLGSMGGGRPRRRRRKNQRNR